MSKVHVLTSSDSQSNLNIEGVYVDRDEAIRAYRDAVSTMANMIGDDSGDAAMFEGNDQMFYVPDDTGEFENMSVRLVFDCPFNGDPLELVEE